MLLKNPSLLSDVRSRSEELYRSLLYLSHEASDAELAEYRMCVEYQNGVCAEYQNGASECQYGEEAVLKTYVFQENGEDVVITHENVHLFVQLPSAVLPVRQHPAGDAVDPDGHARRAGHHRLLSVRCGGVGGVE